MPEPLASRGLVTLVNPNFVKPGVTPYALDILSSYLEDAGFEPEVVDLTFRDDDWGLEEYFAERDPILVGVTLRNAGSVQPQEQRVFLPDHLGVIDAIRELTDAPIVLGGAGFSSMPYAALEYFGTPFGVKGPGETILCDLADALALEHGTTLPVLVLGGALMGISELETVVRLGLPMVIVVYDDDAYGAEVHHFAPDGHPRLSRGCSSGMAWRSA